MEDIFLPMRLLTAAMQHSCIAKCVLWRTLHASLLPWDSEWGNPGFDPVVEAELYHVFRLQDLSLHRLFSPRGL